MDVEPLLRLSALGIYFHAIYISLTFGLPVAIGVMLWLWGRTGDSEYLRAAKLMTMVLVVNFALGAIAGTLVEFGLVQVWPGVNLAIATFAFAPLALELIAFANEIAFLILFVVTLGRVRAVVSMLILAVYAVFAYFSGMLITTVNSWLQAPWGVGPLAKTLYPFMPEYGPLAVDVPKLVAVKAGAMAMGQPLSILVQQPGLAEKVGIVLYDPLVAMVSPYAIVSIFHNILAGILIGMAIAAAGWAYRYYKTGDPKYLKLVKPLIIVIAILFVIQTPIVSHFMGRAVVEYNPTKFALMEGAKETFNNPIIALIAYHDPNKPILGFDHFYAKCEELGETTIGDIASALGLGVYLGALGVDASNIAGVKLKDVCIADLQKAERLMLVVHYAYYAKVITAIIGGLAAATLFFYFIKVPALNPLAVRVASLLGDEKKRVFLLTLLVLAGTVIPAVLGWYVREVGRKPWTVYGLLYPEELATPVPYATSWPFLAFAYLVILAVNIGGLLALYIVATRGYKFLELLKRGVS
ncbi:MAG: cytochrome ubiquinol oxidase subunit I [Thermoprotei archaeon]|nr:cytochrome ubiquinol oxidase subunit I [Thermoprotei archaeon]